MVQIGGNDDEEVDDASPRLARERGGEQQTATVDDLEGDLERLVELAASGGDAARAAFMRAHCAPDAVDDATAEDCPQRPAISGAWSEERLNQRAHAHTQMTVKQVIYGLMKTAAGNIRQGPMDELLKVIKAAMPQPNYLPRCD